MRSSIVTARKTHPAWTIYGSYDAVSVVFTTNIAQRQL